jgi:hypothetical protein
MRHWFEKHVVSLIFGFIGAIFALVGIGFLWGYLYTQQNIKSAQEIPLYSATRLADANADTIIAVEGRIGEQNPSYVEGLVAYTASQYQGIECDDESDDGDRECHEVWQETERKTPTLWLDLPDGRVRIDNTDYELINQPQSWQTTGNLIAYKTLEYQGFRRGNPVFVLGKVNKTDGIVLNADFISGGNRQDYLNSQVEEANVLLVLGVVFGGFGLLFILVAIGMAIRTR